MNQAVDPDPGQQTPDELRPESPRPIDGPGSGLQTAGGLLLALAIPAAIISYVLVPSPIAPARYYRKLQGIDDFGAGLATGLGALVLGLIVSGLVLYAAGVRKERRSRH